MIKLGNTDIEKVYLGANEINKAYLGNQVIFDNTAVNPFADATLAFSLRDLGLGATHVVRVRRDSDNTEQDFTATEITDGSLLSFVGSGDGFVSVWYNQNGINNANQTSASLQSKIVSFGSLITEGNNPALLFDDSLYNFNQAINLNQQLNIFTVQKIDSTGNDFQTIIARNFDGANADFAHRFHASGLQLAAKGNTDIKFVLSDDISYKDVYSLYNSIFDLTLNQNNEMQIFFNAQKQVSITFLNQQDLTTFENTSTNIRIGNRKDEANPVKGTIQEIILFDVNKTAERQSIEQNINTYYAIY